MGKHSGDSPVTSLTPAMFHILLALADGERHGYGIKLEVARASEGGFQLGPGTLYRSIKQMLALGLIEESDERPDPGLDDERRRYYRITSAGRHGASLEAQRLARLVSAARARRLLEDWGDAATPELGGAR
ncbi:MAG TPA: helix-turn-helix transcriptional regulator [Ktedonobacterales bacterium]|jgi:DNA-binding PadR family transcriptional regulator